MPTVVLESNPFHKTTRKYKQHCQKCVNDINCELLDTSYQCFWHCLDNEIILKLGKGFSSILYGPCSDVLNFLCSAI